MTSSFDVRSLGVAAVAVLAAGAPAGAGENPILVSVNQSGMAGGHWIERVSISSTGRYVVFESDGVDLVPGASTALRRVYLRDVLLGQTELISVNSAGQPATTNADHPSMSADARFVLFQCSSSPELPPGGEYLRDRALLTTVPATASDYKANLSDDGQWIYHTAGQAQLTHVTTGAVEVISVSDEGEWADKQIFIDTFQCLSADMRFAIFDTQASNLVDQPTFAQRQVYVRDRLLGTTRLVSATPAGEAGTGSSLSGSISADGRYVAFFSFAKNFADLPADADAQVYVRDLLTGGLELVSVNNAGEISSHVTFQFASPGTTSLSADGRLVASSIVTSNLVPGIAGANQIVVVRDRLAGLTYAGSMDQQGNDALGMQPMFARTGRAIAFITNGELSPQDTNGNELDVYVHDFHPWTEIEPPLAGSAGEPRLVVQGAPQANAPLMLAITKTLPLSLAHLVVGFGQANLPFKGGIMVPVPGVILPLPINAQGLIVVKAHWPAGVPAGTPIFLQAWMPDPAGPAGFAATNGATHIAQ